MRPWQLIGVTIVLFILAQATGWRVFWVLDWALVAALAFSYIWLRLSMRGLQFSRSALGGRAQGGERVEERLALENHSWVPKLWVPVADGSTLPAHHAGYVSSVGPPQPIAWRPRTDCRRRDLFKLWPGTATTVDRPG